jgi:hypothetical protein
LINLPVFYGGNDVITGGAGQDVMFGDGGDDIFNLGSGPGFPDGTYGFDWANYEYNLRYDNSTPLRPNVWADLSGALTNPNTARSNDLLVNIEGLSGSSGNDKLYGGTGTADITVTYTSPFLPLGRAGSITLTLPGVLNIAGGSVVTGVGIAPNAFEYKFTNGILSTLITSVKIAASVKSVGANAFANNDLQSVSFAGNAPVDGGNIFSGNPNLPFVSVPFNATGWGLAYSGKPVNKVRDPGVPTGVQAAAGNAESLVTWVAPADNGGGEIVKYTVISSPGNQTCVWTTGQLGCLVTGLSNGTAYTFRVFATNAFFSSALSAASSERTPAGPELFTYTTTDGKVEVTGCIGTCPTRLIIPATLEIGRASCRERVYSRV